MFLVVEKVFPIHVRRRITFKYIYEMANLPLRFNVKFFPDIFSTLHKNRQHTMKQSKPFIQYLYFPCFHSFRPLLCTKW